MGSMGMLRRLESRGDCIARNPDTEFLRIISGTGQIAEAIRRSGLSEGEEKPGFSFYPWTVLGLHSMMRGSLRNFTMSIQIEPFN